MYQVKQYREAIDLSRRALEIDANFPYIWMVIGLAQLGAGLAREAIASFKRHAELMPWYGGTRWWLAAAYYQAGDDERSQALARKLAQSHGRSYPAASYFAVAGKVDAMFDALEGAYQQRAPLLVAVKNAPLFDPYRADPRFHALLAKMNLA
jgi:tetratricopeptide (TPR) repeat protein